MDKVVCLRRLSLIDLHQANVSALELGPMDGVISTCVGAWRRKTTEGPGSWSEVFGPMEINSEIFGHVGHDLLPTLLQERHFLLSNDLGGIEPKTWGFKKGRQGPTCNKAQPHFSVSVAV